MRAPRRRAWEVRTIVDPNEQLDLSQLSDPERDELERLLSKARKAG
jgi:hypothetical protein